MKLEDTYRCITNMRGVHDYFDRWLRIRDIWAERLDTGPIAQAEHFTPHNHRNHNVGIYYILSNVLIPDSAYGSPLNQEHLFVLNLAVLFHDVMMTFRPEVRHEHSKIAKEFLLERLGDRLGITDNELQAIAQVAMAHSDLKDELGNVTLNTIDKLIEETQNLPTGKMGKINTRILAGLLRLADELDIHSERIEGYQHKDRTIKSSSASHWRICEIMSYPEICHGDVSQIELVPKQDLILLQDNLDNDLHLLKKHETKVYRELTEVRKKIFATGELPGWGIHSLSVRLDGELKEKYTSLQNPFDSTTSQPYTPPIGNETHDNQTTSPEAKTQDICSIIVADEDLAKELNKIVIHNNLLKSGHFKISDDIRARDWINSRVLLENQNILNKICDKFSAFTKDNTYLIGIDHHGLLIASLLGVKTDNPFTYVISEKLDKLHIDKEKEIAEIKDNKVIFITDVIVTLGTVSKIIDKMVDKLGLEFDKIDRIFTVFIRDQVSRDAEKHTKIEDIAGVYGDKIVALNRSFPIEVCSKDKCVFISNQIDMYTDEPQDVS